MTVREDFTITESQGWTSALRFKNLGEKTRLLIVQGERVNGERGKGEREKGETVGKL